MKRSTKTISPAFLGAIAAVFGLMACGAPAEIDDASPPAGISDGAPGDDPAVDSPELADDGVDIVATDSAALPTFVNLRPGALTIGARGVAAREPAIRAALSRIAPVFRADHGSLVLRSVFTDEQGDEHLRFAQRKNGLDVIGGVLVVHARGGEIYAANGRARDDLPAEVTPRITERAAVAAAVGDSASVLGAASEGAPRLAYRPRGDALELVYIVKITGQLDDGLPVDDDVLVSAIDASIVARLPHVHTAKNRKIYTANQGTLLPGTLARSEGGAASSDAVVNTNYDRVGQAYDAYKALFGRDSYDNGGAAIISTVHYGSNYNDAVWNGSQIYFGDGNGSKAINLGSALDVVAHELSHAVTESTSDLEYDDQSGGLNEAMSDILGTACEWYNDGQVVSSDTWKLGEDMYTPGTPGDALRYMNDPALDGHSLDDFRDYDDSVDVHYSSGIANLAFHLLSQGGSHPQGKTPAISVSGVGFSKAAKIFYRANTAIMGSTDGFNDARVATEQAASQLGFSAADVKSVSDAWSAVAVGYCDHVGILPAGDVKVFSVVNGEVFVAAGTRLFKFSGVGGSGHNMFATGFYGGKVCSVPGYGYLLGHQQFQGSVTSVSFVNQHTLVGLSDGKMLKVKGTGGTGANMFAVSETNNSCGFAGVAGYNHYVGSHKFDAGVVAITPVGAQTLISLDNGEMLKVNGAGGSGCNMFAVQETACGFATLPGYSYLVGSQKFGTAVTDVTSIGGQTLVSLDNGKMLKVNGTGGGGCNMFAVQETACGFSTVPGYNYLVGSQKFGAAVVNVTSIGGQTLVSLDSGKMLKVNGTGGGGCNMFAVQESACGFSTVPGYNYLVGSQKFGAAVTDVVSISGKTVIGLADGTMLKVNGTGGSGCNMFAVQASACGFAGLPGYNHFVGSQTFSSGVSDIATVGAATFVSLSGGKMLKVNGAGGGGCNMFAVQESASGFSTVPGYNYYIGDQN